MKNCSSMREMGLEPTRSYNHKILSLACLPIPALPHNESNSTIFMKNCQYYLKNIYKKNILKIIEIRVDRTRLVYYNSYCR